MSDPTSIVRQAYAAFGGGDIPAFLALCSGDIRWQFSGDSRAGYSGTMVGHAQLGEWFAAVGAADDIRAFEPREFFAGPDHVTVLGWEETVARSSGRLFQCEWVHVFQVRDGRITRFWGMLDSEKTAAAR